MFATLPTKNLMLRLASRARLPALVFLTTTSLHAQVQASPSRIANDPEVLGQQRLFSAWLEGQILYRDLPGIVVGVVAGDELVWAKGFGYADVRAKKPMRADTITGDNYVDRVR